MNPNPETSALEPTMQNAHLRDLDEIADRFWELAGLLRGAQELLRKGGDMDTSAAMRLLEVGTRIAEYSACDAIDLKDAAAAGLTLPA